MIVKSIKGTRSYIIIEFEDRAVKMQGELTLTPAFYAKIGSIKNWEEPYQNLKVTDEEKKEIINRVLQYQQSLVEGGKKSIEIIFDD